MSEALRTTVEMAQSLAEMNSNVEVHQGMLKTIAKLHWAKYSALLEEGFTKAQALELCKNLYGG